MKKPSFLLVSCVDMGQDSMQSVGRSVAFPVARTKEGRSLFCTCSHTITEHLGRGGKLILQYPEGEEVPLGRPIINNVIPPELGSDLSFFEVDLDREVEIVNLRDSTISSGLEITHVRNTSLGSDFPDEIYEFTTQTVGGAAGKYALIDDRFHRVDDELKKMLEIIPKSPHKGILIQSWPGVSGSPLWDRYGRVLGMVAGGNQELTERYPDYYLVYLPTKQIQSLMKRFLGEKIG